MKNEFRIESAKHGHARVWLNGAELHCIKDVSTSVGVSRANEVTITFIADKINAHDAPAPQVVETGPEIIEVTNISSDAHEFRRTDA